MKENGEVTGWWFSENSPRHFDYWTKHVVPHILFLCDPENWVFYWVYVEPDEVTSTEQGAKILVPADQIVDEDYRRDLAAVAYDRNSPPTLEGTAFQAAAQNLTMALALRGL